MSNVHTILVNAREWTVRHTSCMWQQGIITIATVSVLLCMLKLLLLNTYIQRTIVVAELWFDRLRNGHVIQNDCSKHFADFQRRFMAINGFYKFASNNFYLFFCNEILLSRTFRQMINSKMKMRIRQFWFIVLAGVYRRLLLSVKI